MARDPGIEGAAVPLFDRLVNDTEGLVSEPRPYRMLTRDGLRDSVMREVGRLLNTRLSVSELDIEGHDERTVLTYGIPDFGAMGSLSGIDQYQLADVIAKTVERFEPRLVDVQVDIEHLSHEENRLQARVGGTLKVGRIIEPVSFPVNINAPGDDPAGGT
ncbi:MAG: type VI secretion system baseplate subunit TssE [Magnetovibrionaceae bacterium]